MVDVTFSFLALISVLCSLFEVNVFSKLTRSCGHDIERMIDRMMGEKEVTMTTTTRRSKTAFVLVAVLYCCAAVGHAFSVRPPLQRPQLPLTPRMMIRKNLRQQQQQQQSSSFSKSLPFATSSTCTTRHYFKAETKEEEKMALQIQEEVENKAQQEQAKNETWQEQEKVERMATFLSSRLGMAFLKAKQQQQDSIQAPAVKEGVVAEDNTDAVAKESEKQLVVAEESDEELLQVETLEEALKTEVEKDTAKLEPRIEAKETETFEKEPLDNKMEDETAMKDATANPLENLELIIEKAAAASGKDEDFEKSLQKGKPPKAEPQQQQDETAAAPLEMQDDEQESDRDSTTCQDKDKVVEERPVSLHQKEGDRVVALKDEFSTGDEAVVPPVVSTSFGRPLEVIEAGVPPLRTNTKASSPSPSSPPTEADSSTDQQQQQQSSSSLKAMPVTVEREQDVIASALRDGEKKPETLEHFLSANAADATKMLEVNPSRATDTATTTTTTTTEASMSMQDAVASARLPPEERQQQKQPTVKEVKPELAQMDEQKGDETKRPDLVIQKETQITKKAAPDLVQTAAEETATTSPIPNEQKKKDSLADETSQTISEKAFDILLNLGMITRTPDPRDPDYDHSKDDELCPENKWKKQ